MQKDTKQLQNCKETENNQEEMHKKTIIKGHKLSRKDIQWPEMQSCKTTGKRTQKGKKWLERDA